MCWAAGLCKDKPWNMAFSTDHAAPEVLKGLTGWQQGAVQISALSPDIWSLGCLAAMLYSGSNFFKGADPETALKSQQDWVSQLFSDTWQAHQAMLKQRFAQV